VASRRPERLSVSLSVQERAALQAEADLRGMKLSALIRAALLEYLRRERPDRPQGELL